MRLRTMLSTATVLMAFGTPAVAQSGQNGQSVRDILNRAQTQSERKAVEDLIGKLRTNQPPGAPQAPPAATAQPDSPAPSVASPAAPPAATQPDAPAATAAQPAPVEAPPAAVAAPRAPDQPATDQTAASRPAEAAPAEPVITVAPSDQAPASAPSAVTRTETAPADAAPAAATPVSAPAGRAARENRRAARPRSQVPAAAAGNDTAPIGAPIGPAEALPTPIVPSEAEMSRAPEIASERGLPTVDIEVLFDYDSSDVSPSAAASLMTLGQALADPRLAGQRFVIAGHTDAKGATGYNLGLSDRRAKAVRAFLIEHFKIAPENLIARGFGESRLKNPRNPLGPENRRVQIINWTDQLVGQRRR